MYYDKISYDMIHGGYVYGKEERETQKAGGSSPAGKDTGAFGAGRCERYGRHPAAVSGNDRRIHGRQPGI